jgi:hypothetical protein
VCFKLKQKAKREQKKTKRISNKILISICHIKTISRIVDGRLERHRPQKKSGFKRFLNSICRVSLLFPNSLELYLCNLSFLTFFSFFGNEKKRVHIHFISFGCFCYTYRFILSHFFLSFASVEYLRVIKYCYDMFRFSCFFFGMRTLSSVQ